MLSTGSFLQNRQAMPGQAAWAGLTYLCGPACSHSWTELGHFGPKPSFSFISVFY
jgi:hypothetical protein